MPKTVALLQVVQLIACNDIPLIKATPILLKIGYMFQTYTPAKFLVGILTAFNGKNAVFFTCN